MQTDATPLAVSRSYPSGLTHIPTAGGTDAAGRAGLDPRIRRKLEALELQSDSQHALVMTLSERVREADETRRQAESHREYLRTNPHEARGTWVADRTAGPSARRWQPAPGQTTIEADAEVTSRAADLERLVAARDAATERWRALSRVATRAREYLGVGR